VVPEGPGVENRFGDFFFFQSASAKSIWQGQDGQQRAQKVEERKPAGKVKDIGPTVRVRGRQMRPNEGQKPTWLIFLRVLAMTKLPFSCTP